MWGFNANFLAKVIPRNWCSSTIRISVESSLSMGLLCILWRSQKCIHCFVFGEFETIFNVPVVYLILF